MGDAELRAILAEGGLDFSAEICEDAPISCLAASAINEFRERWAKKSGNARIAEWTNEEVLANAELIEDGKLTYAALILFGTRPALGKFLSQAEVIFEYRSSEASGPAAARQDFAMAIDQPAQRTTKLSGRPVPL